MDTATDLAVGEQGKEALDLVEPGGAGRRVVDVPVRSLEQPVAGGRRFVGGAIVHDVMNFNIGWDVRFDLVEEAACRAKHLPMTRPVVTSSAANSELVLCRW